jgi:hypothetical protein
MDEVVPAWFEGADPAAAGFTYTDEASKQNAITEFKGYLQNRGYDKLDPKVVAFGAIKAHRAAEQHLGIPPDQIVRMPKDANDQAGWAALRTRLGVPADGKYDFSAVKFADGTALDEPFTQALGKALADANVSKDRAAGVAASVVKFMETAETENAAKYQVQVAEEKAKLSQNWGSKAAVNLVVAQNAIKALGVDPKQVASLESAIGYAGVMEMFRNIGARIGEDRFVTSGTSGNPGPMTKEQASATLKERMADVQWITKLQNGDFAVRQEFDNLTRVKTFG